MPIVDPRRLATSRNSKRESRVAFDALCMMGLAVELRPLEPIAHWQPIAQRLEELADTMRGNGGVTKREVSTIRAWAHTWAALDSRLQKFYAHHLDNADATRALYRILDGGEQLEGWQYGRLKRLWIDYYGFESSVLIAPIKSRE